MKTEPQYCAFCRNAADGPNGLCRVCHRKAELIAAGTFIFTRQAAPPKPRTARYMRRSRTMTVQCRCGTVFTYPSKNGGARRHCDRCRTTQPETLQ